jgi:hypothetical protein
MINKLNKLQASWFDGLIFCNAHGMQLVSIETKEENDFLKEHLDSLGKHILFNVYIEAKSENRKYS